MKRLSVVIIEAVAFLLLILLAGCTTFISSAESTFFSKFSLRELVQRNKTQNQLNCSSGSGGGGGGSRFSTTGIGTKESSFHKGESISCSISDAQHFDEAELIAALKQIVMADLTENKAKIVSSSNPDAASFYFEYALAHTTGNVKISGQTVPGNYYSLTASLEETKGKAK